MTSQIQALLPIDDLAWASIQSGQLYPSGTFSPPDAQKRVEHLEQHAAMGRPGMPPNPHRTLLQSWLRSENAFTPLSPPQTEALQAVGSPDSLFILTGQQPGLLGGPLLTVLKALTAAALAKRYTALLQRPVIPLFWIAGDDADLAEANTAEFIWTHDGVTPTLRLPFSEPERKLPIGTRGLSSEVTLTLQQSLPKTWPPELVANIEAAYAPGQTLVDGFKKLLHPYLAAAGILFIDGGAQELKTLSHPFFKTVLQASPQFFTALRASEKQLKANGLQPQVELPPRALPGFALVDGERQRLTSEQPEGLGKLPDFNAPLTHDALSRPLLCEAAFPVLGHVLGPAELRYFLQLTEVFTHFTGSKPLMQPRQNVVIVPGPLAQKLRDLELGESLWPRLTPEKLRAHLRERAWKQHPASQNPPDSFFVNWSAEALEWQTRYFAGAPLPQSLLRRLEFALSQFEKTMKKQALRDAEARGNMPATQQIQAWLRPLALGSGQDRHLTALSLHAAMGKEAFLELLSQLNPEYLGTQIVTVS